MAALEPRGSSYYAAPTTSEHRRLQDAESRLKGADWKNIGPYVVDREWGLPREDYTPEGNAWSGFPHDQARSRAYRWAEDGIAGVCNRFQNWVMALTLWNGNDPILKERFFGLSGPEGNHAEDAKEIWAHEDATPCATWLRLRYVYPMQEYPYSKLAEMSRARSRLEREPELPEALEGGLSSLLEGHFWDVAVEYGKASADEILMRIRARNMRPMAMGAEGAATLHILPTLWFRNTWSWGYDSRRPALRAVAPPPAGVSAPTVGACDAAFTGYASGSPAAPWVAQAYDEGALGVAEVRCVGWERHVGGMRWAVTVPEHADDSAPAPASGDLWQAANGLRVLTPSPSAAPAADSYGSYSPSLSAGMPTVPVPVSLSPPPPAAAAAAAPAAAPAPAAKPSTTDAAGPHPMPRGRLVQPVQALVTDNDTNYVRVFGLGAKAAQSSPHSKDAFHDHVIGSTDDFRSQIKPAGADGTKAAAWVVLEVPAGGTGEVWCRLRVEGRRLHGDGCEGERTRAAAAYAHRAALASNMGIGTSEVAPRSQGSPGRRQGDAGQADGEFGAAAEVAAPARGPSLTSAGASLTGSMMFAERSLSGSLAAVSHGSDAAEKPPRVDEAAAMEGLDADLDAIFAEAAGNGSESDGHSSAGDAPMFAYSSLHTSSSMEGLALDPLAMFDTAIAASNAASLDGSWSDAGGVIDEPEDPAGFMVASARSATVPREPDALGSPRLPPVPPRSSSSSPPGYMPAVAALESLPLPESAGSAGAELVPAHDRQRDAALAALQAVEEHGWHEGTHQPAAGWRPWDNFAAVMEQRRLEADAFYFALQPPGLAEEDRRIQRQAFSGLVWTKGFYHFGVSMWLDGDPAFPPPPESRKEIRNASWRHLYVASVVSLPDKWEYGFFAVWDLAFHMIPMCILDPEWSKRQLLLFMREWLMHGSGAMPAYEWNFDDANPPVHAWACLRVFQITRRASGAPDTGFLERAFHKLLLNFQFWTNRVDPEGRNLFGGGFLGLDNISPINRSEISTTSGLEDLRLMQADGTAWMAFYCGSMLSIALELAQHNPAYEDVASKFLEHFVVIAHACDDLWHDADGFYYDWARPNHGHGTPFPIRVRSYVGLIPLFANIIITDSTLRKLPSFRARMAWFVRHRREWCAEHVYTTRLAQAPVVGISESVESFAAAFGTRRAPADPLARQDTEPDTAPAAARDAASCGSPEKEGLHLLTLVSPARLGRILDRVLDEQQFLSPHGVRSLSREHKDKPYTFRHRDFEASIQYDPADSTSPLFGGNSNWRGCTWFPINHLLIESLQRYDYFFGDDFQVQHKPLGASEPRPMHLWDVSSDLSDRLISLFRTEPPPVPTTPASRRAESPGSDAASAASAPNRPPSAASSLDELLGLPAPAADATATRRPAYGSVSPWMDRLDCLKELHQFYEFFDGDTGAGHGAAHQTGWTALVAKLVQQQASTRRASSRTER